MQLNSTLNPNPGTIPDGDLAKALQGYEYKIRIQEVPVGQSLLHYLHKSYPQIPVKTINVTTGRILKETNLKFICLEKKQKICHLNQDDRQRFNEWPAIYHRLLATMVRREQETEPNVYHQYSALDELVRDVLLWADSRFILIDRAKVAAGNKCPVFVEVGPEKTRTSLGCWIVGMVGLLLGVTASWGYFGWR